jgi:hypothetical protein
LRYVTRAAQIRPIDFPESNRWRLDYLNDNGAELVQQEGLVRGRGAIAFSFQYIELTSAVWDNVHDLPPDFQPPTWDDLILDAHNALPEIGPSVVLAATALEVFVGQILHFLAKTSTLPPDLWQWINHRDGEWLREPSVNEQFDLLLKVLAGYSLKEDATLWEAFQNLKAARNSFVHEGTARVGRTRLTIDQTRRLLGKAVEIISGVRGRLPEELQWKTYEHRLKLQAKIPIVSGQVRDCNVTRDIGIEKADTKAGLAEALESSSRANASS